MWRRCCQQLAVDLTTAPVQRCTEDASASNSSTKMFMVPCTWRLKWHRQASMRPMAVLPLLKMLLEAFSVHFLASTLQDSGLQAQHAAAGCLCCCWVGVTWWETAHRGCRCAAMCWVPMPNSKPVPCTEPGAVVWPFRHSEGCW